MLNVEPSSKPINRNNGNLSTLEDFGKSKKEGFATGTWLTFNYDPESSNSEHTPSNNANAVINGQIDPLKKQQVQWNLDADKITSNYNSIIGDYTKMEILRDQLNENPPFETRTIEIGPSATSNIKMFDVPGVDMSYQRLSVDPIINSENEDSQGSSPDGEASYDPEDTFALTLNSRTITVTKTGPAATDGTIGGWGYNLRINIKVETIPDKKYFHHKDDWEFGDTRKTQREQHMGDAKELLLYTNQFYIIGSITTALTLIFAYKHFV